MILWYERGNHVIIFEKQLWTCEGMVTGNIVIGIFTSIPFIYVFIYIYIYIFTFIYVHVQKCFYKFLFAVNYIYIL